MMSPEALRSMREHYNKCGIPVMPLGRMRDGHISWCRGWNQLSDSGEQLTVEEDHFGRAPYGVAFLCGGALDAEDWAYSRFAAIDVDEPSLVAPIKTILTGPALRGETVTQLTSRMRIQESGCYEMPSATDLATAAANTGEASFTEALKAAKAKARSAYYARSQSGVKGEKSHAKIEFPNGEAKDSVLIERVGHEDRAAFLVLTNMDTWTLPGVEFKSSRRKRTGNWTGTSLTIKPTPYKDSGRLYGWKVDDRPVERTPITPEVMGLLPYVVWEVRDEIEALVHGDYEVFQKAREWLVKSRTVEHGTIEVDEPSYKMDAPDQGPVPEFMRADALRSKALLKGLDVPPDMPSHLNTINYLIWRRGWSYEYAAHWVMERIVDAYTRSGRRAAYHSYRRQATNDYYDRVLLFAESARDRFVERLSAEVGMPVKARDTSTAALMRRLKKQ